MSAIALVVGDTSHSATSNTNSHLTALGHTVTLFDSSALGIPATFDSYDIIMTVRLISADYIADGDAIRGLLSLNKPLVLSMMQGGSYVGSYLVRAGLIGSYEQLSNNSGLKIIQNTHPITDAYLLDATPNVVNLTFGTHLAVSDMSYAGTMLGHNPNSLRGNLFAVDSGSFTIDGALTTVPRMVIADYIYGAAGYGVDAPALTTAIIDWVLEPLFPTLGQRWPRGGG